MTEKTNQTIKNILLISGITIAVYLGMRYILPLVVPFLLAYAIAWLLHGLVKKICNAVRLPRGLVSLVSVGVFIVLFLAPILFLLYKGICEIGLLLSNYESLMARVDATWCDCCERIEKLSGIDGTRLRDFGRENAVKVVEAAQSKAVPYMMNLSMVSIKFAGGLLAKFFVTVVTAVLILKDYELLHEWAKKCSFYCHLERMGTHMCRAGGSYIKAQLLIMTMVCVVCITALFISGNPYAIVIGILMGLADALPFIGTGSILIPWVIIELFRGAYRNAIIYGILYVVCTFIREFIEPKLVGKDLGVHPLAILMSIYIGVCIYGIAGVVLGPVTVFLVWELYLILAKEKESSKFEDDR